ncbi:MAG: Holliday junction resolvase RuvX [Betaproteobacteria bacterium]|nr:MAG: Holliday junction resolvase RuvX [Betaproteobacteria bacterium]
MAVAANSPAAPAGSVLAFDFGTQRIGVAVGETGIGVAHPLATIAAKSGRERFESIRALIEEWQPVLLVVGLPTHADGTAHAMTARALRFARQLEGRFGLPVTCCDERHTTQDAELALRGAGVRGRAGRTVRDRVAAQLILQAYLDHRLAT